MPFVSINNQEIFYKDSGGTGQVLLFFHGFLMNQSMFDAYEKALSGTYRIVRFDARSFGQTKWDGKPYTLYDTASDCIGLMDFLQIEKAALAGMSQGGYAALRTALRYPERVAGLVLLSTQAGADDDETKKLYRQGRDVWKNQGPVLPLLEAMMTGIIGSKTDPKVAPFWNVWMPEWQKISGEAVFHAYNNLIERDDISDELSKITQPALVVHGDADLGVNCDFGKKMHQNLPGAQQFLNIPGGEHGIALTHSKSIIPAIQSFLDNNL